MLRWGHCTYEEPCFPPAFSPRPTRSAVFSSCFKLNVSFIIWVFWNSYGSWELWNWTRFPPPDFHAITTAIMFIFKKKRVLPLPLKQSSYISQKKYFRMWIPSQMVAPACQEVMVSASSSLILRSCMCWLLICQLFWCCLWNTWFPMHCTPNCSS